MVSFFQHLQFAFILVWARGKAMINCWLNPSWWLPPSSSHGEFCESVFAHGSSMHQKCSNYALNNLLFGLCRSMWTIDPLVTHTRPHPGTPAHPFTSKMLWTRERTLTPYPFVVFTFGLVVESIKKFGGASLKSLKPWNVSCF
jgi:hypothetical protein